MERDRRSTTLSAPLVVAVRILLLGLAAAAVAAAVVVSRHDDPSAARRYVCPMHSEVTAPAPGDCPICGMALQEVTSAIGAVPHHASSGGAETVSFAALRASTESTTLLKYSVARVRRSVFRADVHAPAIAADDGAVTAQLYRDELASTTPDELAEFFPTTAPDAPVKVRRDATPPTTQGAIARVSFRAEPGAPAIPPGQIGWVKLASKARAALVVRSGAIVQSADGPYVLTFSSKLGVLTKHRVEVGKDYDDMTAIVAGLTDKDYVVMANTFSFDAERRLQAGP